MLEGVRGVVYLELEGVEIVGGVWWSVEEGGRVS